MRRMHRRTFLAAAASTALSSSCAPAAVVAQSAARDRVGLDAAALADLAARARALPRLHSLLIARDGAVLYARAFRGPGLDRPANIKSASKTVLSAIAGAAIARGVLTGVDQPIGAVLGSRVPASADPAVRRITVGDLLSMRAGLQSTSGQNYGAWAASPDLVAHALSRPLVDQPGGRMIYSTGTSHILSAVLARASGRSTLALARDWLGEPLGVEVPAWSADAQGVYLGGNDMRLTPRALLRFAELYRMGGVWNGRQVLTPGWITESWLPRGQSAWSGNAYGYGWWLARSRGHELRFAWGYGGQMAYVLPDLRLSVVVTSDPSPARRDGHVQAVHALLDQVIVPAAEAGGGTAAVGAI